MAVFACKQQIRFKIPVNKSIIHSGSASIAELSAVSLMNYNHRVHTFQSAKSKICLFVHR